MVFAVVNDAGTVVMHHNEKLDAWLVYLNDCFVSSVDFESTVDLVESALGP